MKKSTKERIKIRLKKNKSAVVKNKEKNTKKEIKAPKQRKTRKKKINTIEDELKQQNKKKSKHKRKISFFTVVICFLIIANFSLVMYRYSKISELKYNINKKIQMSKEKDNEIKLIKLKIDEASRSDIIEKKAIEELHMNYRNQNQIEYITVN